MISDHESPLPPGDAPPCLVDVGVYADAPAAAERGLVVLAMGRGYWILDCPDGFHLAVEPAGAPAVREQLACFEAESSHWPPRSLSMTGRREPSLPAAGLVALVLAATFLADETSGGRLRAAGLLDARAAWSSGHWWRTVTALTLHADVGHLLGNIAGAAFFGHFVVQRFGAGTGWLLIVVAGVLGNLVTAWFFREAGHLSLGASTAVFGALGLLAGSGLRTPVADAPGPSGKTRRTLLPFAAALVLLGWLGTGGPETDVFAHTAGFFAAVLLGCLTVARSVTEDRPMRQRLCAIAALALPASSWAVALAVAR